MSVPTSPDALYNSLKHPPDWCECSEYPRAAHSHLADGSHGAPFVSLAAYRDEQHTIAGLKKGTKADNSPKAKIRFIGLESLCTLIGSMNFEAARKFYEYTHFWEGA